MNSKSVIEVAESLATVAPDEWNRLTGRHPFLSHAFLHALHETGCASAETGWLPQYLLMHEGNTLSAAMPMYLKNHSYGEYVFDWAWADAYHRHGLTYYPKLVCAVPFTPVTTPRLLVTEAGQRAALLHAALALARRLDASSLHILFPDPADLTAAAAAGLLQRQGRQFHWRNDGYRDFEDFLSRLNHDKRKKIRQERRKVREAGISFTWREGRELTDADWVFFNRCYRQTYREHQSSPYLNLAFFRRIGQSLAEAIAMIVAERDGAPVGASLLFKTDTHLYGRHWGAVEHHPLAHFEACYYQGIEYAIANGLQIFEGGAQGEHKMARGLMPVNTVSAHWLAHPEFAAAIENYLDRETAMMTTYNGELAARSPFRKS